MTTFHMFLVILGLVIIAISYFVSEKMTNTNKNEQMKDRNSEPMVLTEDEKNIVGVQIEAMIHETSEMAVSKADDRLRSISNEKIMAVSEFSDQILAKIEQNHTEVVFLYNMLNEKEIALKETLNKIDRTKVELEKAVKDHPPSTETVKTQNRKNRNTKKEIKKSEVPPNNILILLGEEQPDIPAQGTAGTGEMGKNSNDQILKLYAEGKSGIEIAKILELGQGEVNLVIELFQGVRK